MIVQHMSFLHFSMSFSSPRMKKDNPFFHVFLLSSFVIGILFLMMTPAVEFMECHAMRNSFVSSLHRSGRFVQISEQVHRILQQHEQQKRRRNYSFPTTTRMDPFNDEQVLKKFEFSQKTVREEGLTFVNSNSRNGQSRSFPSLSTWSSQPPLHHERRPSNSMQTLAESKLTSDSSFSVSFDTWNAAVNQYPEKLRLNFTLYIDPKISPSLQCGFSRDTPCTYLYHALYHLDLKLQRDFYNFTHSLTNFKRAIILDIILMNDLEECGSFLRSNSFSNLKYFIKIQSDPLRPLETFRFVCLRHQQFPIIGDSRLDIQLVMFHRIQLSIYQYNCVGYNYIFSQMKFEYSQLLINFDACGNGFIQGDYVIVENCEVLRAGTFYLFPYHYTQIIILGMQGDGYYSLILIQYCSLVIIRDWNCPFGTHFFQDVGTFQVLNSRIVAQSLTLNKVTNVLVQDTQFEDFNALSYASFYADFGNEINFKNVSGVNGEQLIHVQGYVKVVLSDVNVQHNVVERGPRPSTYFRDVDAIISLTQTFQVTIVNCLFFNNTGKLGSALYMDNIYLMEIVSSSFISNSAETGGAIYVASFSKTYFYGRAEFKNCLFDNNSAQEFGGAVYIKIGLFILFTECNFRNNRATYMGGAFFIGFVTKSISIDYSVFTNNTVIGNHASLDTKGNHASVDSGGGAICVSNVYLTQHGANFRPFQNALFIENSAPRGGAIFYFPWSNAGVQFLNNTFVRNRASLSGGAMYIVGTHRLANGSNVFIYNTAQYGPEVGYSIFKVRVYSGHHVDMKGIGDTSTTNDGDSYNIIPGGVFEFQIKTFDELGNYLPASSENLQVNSTDPLVYVRKVFTTPNSLQVIFYILTNDTSFYGNSNYVTINVTFAGETARVNTEILVNIYSCPSKYKLDKVPTDLGKIVYGCVEIPEPNYLLIFGIAIPLSIFTFIIGTFIAIVATYSIKIIRRKLKILQEKERAEHEMQQKLIDKNLIFDINIDTEECVTGQAFGDELSHVGSTHEMMDQHIIRTKPNTLSQGSSSSQSKKSNSSSSSSKSRELAIPLLLNDHVQQQKEASQINSFIIPIEDIKIERKIGEGGNGGKCGIF